LADKPPPGRYSVVERGGRLVVIDRETGRTPPTAAERMAEHDRRMGVEPIRPAARAELAAPAPAPAKIPQPPAAPAHRTAPGRKQPWQEPQPKRPGNATLQSARPQGMAQPPRTSAAPARKTIVTGKWWDAKGPRTIELGPRGQQKLTSGFIGLFFAALAAAILLLFIAPVLLFAAAFLLFRFGGSLLGPLGASIVDKALAEKG
jgi:hypothetical protein